jgi:hypothetical protein
MLGFEALYAFMYLVVALLLRRARDFISIEMAKDRKGLLGSARAGGCVNGDDLFFDLGFHLVRLGISN